MQLYGSFTSPYVRQCRIAMVQCEIDHTFIETDLIKSAEISPTKKVPFLKDGELSLSDSSSILRHLRHTANQAFLATIEDLELFCLISTLMDSAINLFYLEKEGIAITSANYLQRQQLRLEEGLDYLNKLLDKPVTLDLQNDAQLRLGIFLSWGLFRQRFNLDDRENLQRFVSTCESHVLFQTTQPQ